MVIYCKFLGPSPMPNIPGMPVTTPINLPGMPPITGSNKILFYVIKNYFSFFHTFGTMIKNFVKFRVLVNMLFQFL